MKITIARNLILTYGSVREASRDEWLQFSLPLIYYHVLNFANYKRAICLYLKFYQ